MATRKAIKGKPLKLLPKAFAQQTVAEINALLKSRKKLDLELKKVERRIKTLLGHHYFG